MTTEEKLKYEVAELCSLGIVLKAVSYINLIFGGIFLTWYVNIYLEVVTPSWVTYITLMAPSFVALYILANTGKLCWLIQDSRKKHRVFIAVKMVVLGSSGYLIAFITMTGLCVLALATLALAFGR